MTAIREVDVSLPSLRMHALTCGEEGQPTVVLLHGFPEFSESWRDILPVVAEAGFYAVAPDLRGYGGSDKPARGYDMDTLSQDVAELIAKVAPDGTAHLVGHDWGGAIAYHVAAHHPARVHTLSVVNCPHPAVMARRIWWPRQLRRSWYIFLFQLPLLPEYMLHKDAAALVPRILRAGMVDHSRLPPERARLYAENFIQPGVARCAVAYYRQVVRGTFTLKGARRLLRSYPKIRTPFRLIWGTEDVALGRELTEDLGPWFDGPTAVDYLPGVGHFSNIEAPERVAASILDHVRTSTRNARIA